MNIPGYWRWCILAFVFGLTLAQHGSWDSLRIPQHKGSTCESGSCYPPSFGNLLIGREDKLYASSTCGLHFEERFCIVSHLEDPKKCFTCDSRSGTENDPLLNHRIQNIIYSDFPNTTQPSWWQSENGKEHVYIQLDLEAEFHFTHLIIKFKTFRPAAMLVERSSDNGRTWKIYRVFAADCDKSFPNYPKRSQRSLSEVVCDSRYSKAIPSNDGEMILRVILPGRTYNDPYSRELQDLLKMTNLRINFTKLHTLGDDLLDRRQEIQEKYYYAIREMTVRGSCWCYGHASSCLPVDGVQHTQDMVHGRCNCTHNTKGINCRECDDFYNDLPWQPAVGRFTNACKKCNCNNHATKCKFNETVFQQSGRVSGGVCIDCQDHTIGTSCEKCEPFYYLDPSKDINDRDACISCKCDVDGTTDNGQCDPLTDIAIGLVAGQCHCKQNVHGVNCDQCKPGYWNFNPLNPEGCQACTCDLRGTQNNSGCDPISGECICKPYVVHKDCKQCSPQYWGLSPDSDGCKPCDCIVGASLDNNCDVVTGQCKCRPHIVGRTCDSPDQSFFIPKVDIVYEAEYASCFGDCQVVFLEPPHGVPPQWTGPGYMRVYDNSHLDFKIDDVKSSMEYNLIIRYKNQTKDDWSEVEVEVKRDYPVESNSVCANTQPRDDHKLVDLPSRDHHAVVSPPICLESGKNYQIKIYFRNSNNNLIDSPSTSILVDSIALIPQIDSINFFHGSPANEYRRNEYKRQRCSETFHTPNFDTVSPVCKQYHYEIAAYIHGGAYDCSCDKTGSKSTFCSPNGGDCECKPNVVGRTCNSCAAGTYGFGPEGCKPCDCHPFGALTNNCDDKGQCPCKNGTYGRSCDKCRPGSWNYPDCQLCKCHGHALTCDTNTGECIACEDNSDGFHCERCKPGFYGDPRFGYDIPCRECKCPDTAESGHSFASRCNLNESTQDLLCECDVGYSGPQCSVCADNYYGNPEEPGGNCIPCECNNNIDIAQPGNCDLHTGECLLCLFNTTGRQCEICRPNFYGNAIQQRCTECVCSMLGTDLKGGPCNHTTGQCPCLPNVQGKSCESCKPNHWKIASGHGCESCDCDLIGSLSEQCNEFDGQCQCKAGFGGRRCSECQKNFWGNPNIVCKPCECNTYGSETSQCHQNNGTCICLEGVGGNKCDNCARGFLGEAPNCKRCGECFDNWNYIINNLSEKTDHVILNAREINRTGATGAYNSEFEDLSRKIDEVRNTLNSTKNNTVILISLATDAEFFKEKLAVSRNKMNQIKDEVNNVLNQISVSNLSLKPINEKAQKVIEAAQELSDNATRLQEQDLQGALNLTREAGETSKQVHVIEKKTAALLSEADRQCRRTEQFLNKDSEHFVKTDKKNEDLCQHLEFKLSELQKIIPNINKNVCDGEGDPCDSLCGGGGCESCGGISCEAGAVRRSESGLKLAKDTEVTVENQYKDSDKKLRDVYHALQDAIKAQKIIKDAHNSSMEVKNICETLLEFSTNTTREVGNHLNSSGATPKDIRTVANETLELNIGLKPEKIKELASQINEKIASLKDVNMILEATKDDQANATLQKQKANDAKYKAEKTLEKATKVVAALEEAQHAQEEARSAINQANQDISAAKKDWTQIKSETGDADVKANEAIYKVDYLYQNLSHIQEIVFKNNHEAKQVSNEAQKVSKEVDVAKSDVSILKKEYDIVASGLKEKSDNSSKSKMRAKNLLDSAHQLLGDTKSKLKDLEDAEEGYKFQKMSLQRLLEEAMKLTTFIDGITQDINKKAEYYKRCVK